MTEPYWEPLSGAAFAPVTIGTTLPASPVDGQEAILVDSLTAPTYAWRFRYSASITDAYKWVFIGGSEPTLYAGVGAWAAIGTASTWMVLSPSLSFPVPRTGHYDAITGAQASIGGGGYTQIAVGYASGPQGVQHAFSATSTPGYFSSTVGSRVFDVPAGGDVRAWYWADNTGGMFANRWLRVSPVRVA